MGIYVLQRSLCGGAACFRLKVRGERLKARSFYRFALNYFYVVARGAGVSQLIVNIFYSNDSIYKKAVIPLIEITALIINQIYYILVFQTTNRNNIHTILSAQSNLATRKNYQQVWLTNRHLLLSQIMLTNQIL